MRAQIRAADARAEAAAARYERAVISSLSDSEAALNRFAASAAVERQAEAALARQSQAFELAQTRVARGEDDRMALARAALQLEQARGRRTAASEAKASAAVALFKALGGGWQSVDAQAALQAPLSGIARPE